MCIPIAVFTIAVFTMVTILTHPFVAFQGMYKPHCPKIKLFCKSNTVIYTSNHNKPLCEGEVILVDKHARPGYYEHFYLHQGTRIETSHKVFELYQFKKWRNFKPSTETSLIDKDGIYVIVTEVPYMKYTIRKSTFCKHRVEFVCGNTPSDWITISEFHFIETDHKDYFICD